MYFKSLDYPIIVIDKDYDSPRIGGILIRQLVEELRQNEQRVLCGLTLEDARAGARTYVAASAVLISIDSSEGFCEKSDHLISFLKETFERRPNLPVFLYGERSTIERLPSALLKYVHGFIFLFEDTKTFIARQVMRAAESYMQNLLPPFFKALINHTAASNYSWHTPGHAGGVAFTKSPVGRAFHQFFGENTLRSDLSVSVPELGSLLDHTGPIKQAEAAAAVNFGADHTFFVTNGTSTANKIVWHGCVARGDVVFIDRNCHKSLLHSLIMTGAVPVYFSPSRNAHGIIGPISLDQFSPKALEERIAKNPLASKAYKAGAKVRMAVVTNSTYDGLCYNVERIASEVGNKVEYLHFDEAWYAYAAFHPFYECHYGMAKGKPRGQDAIIFTTHSTHKLLAAFSQASMIHVRDAADRKLDVARFNESFMMHTTTSPHYGVIASCDVASKMMEGKAGESLVQEMHDEAIAFRRAMLHVRNDLKKDDWWFSVWQPSEVESTLDHGSNAAAPVHTKRESWYLKPGDKWHGYDSLVKDYVLIDPVKVTLLTPGLNMDGSMDEHGIPATVLSRFLWSRGLTVEKTNLYSTLFLFSMGITKGKWSTLVTELLAFKELYDSNAPISKALPSLYADYPETYKSMGLRDLCHQLHAFNKEFSVAKVNHDMYVGLPEPVMTPAEAYNHLVKGEIEQVEIDKCMGRVAGAMIVPYPPGIPTIMPGERFGDANDPILMSLKIAREQSLRFPGFESDVHGLIPETREDGSVAYMVEVLTTEK